MVSLTLYVEGGGDHDALKSSCRKGFAQFLEKAGLKGRMPRIVASGSRQNAYKDFVTALAQGKNALLLVDSEAPVTTASPWAHLAERPGDAWEKPDHAEDDQCHLMVQCMESWLIADRETLAVYFGQGFQTGALPAPDPQHGIECIEKKAVYHALAKATHSCRSKGPYTKGTHSFELLSRVDPTKVALVSPWAKRFLQACQKVPVPV